MKKSVILHLLILLLISNCLHIKGQEKHGTYQVIEIPAPSLKNNLIGTDTVQKIGIYLPASYHSSEKSYPVVYFLEGFNVPVPEKFPEIKDIMENNTVQEMIYVGISGYNLYKGSWYTNSPVTGNWEDYVTHDVVSYIDNHYRTIKDRKSRGLAGASMGGCGAFNISLKHSDKYSAIQLMCPFLIADTNIIKGWVYMDSLNYYLKSISDNMRGTPRNKFSQSLIGAMDSADNRIWVSLGIGVAFAPDTTQPLFLTPSLNFHTDGSSDKNENVWKLWAKGYGNLEEKVKMHQDNLKQYTYYGMDIGYDDNVVPDIKVLDQLSSFMLEAKVPYALYYYDGDHVNKNYENLENRIMPLMSVYLTGE